MASVSRLRYPQLNLRNTYDRDTVTAGASVPLESDVATLVNCETVVLVHDSAVMRVVNIRFGTIPLFGIHLS